MTEKKLTEAEIMKEIETLLQIAKFVNSDYVTSPFETRVLVPIVDLINRKNAEIEKLKLLDKMSEDMHFNEEIQHKNKIAKLEREKEELAMSFEKANRFRELDDFEDLQKQLSIFKKLLDKAEVKMEQIRAEAIKEFVEKASDKGFYDMNYGEAVVCCYDLVATAKEMGVEL